MTETLQQKVRHNIYIPQEMYDKMKSVAKRNHTSFNSVAIQGIEFFLDSLHTNESIETHRI